jgi:1-acyl-sn-glycerol-3-phosphate acyltransferase
MAALRALLITIVLTGFILLGVPLQWGVTRVAPRFSAVLPIVFCRCLLSLLKIRLSVEGRRLTDAPVLMVSNHISWLDILALGAINPFCFLAKREVASWPILSAFADVQGTIFVDRQRRRQIPQVNRQMAARMAEGRAVLLFPEGTTHVQADPGPFRTSHFAAARDYLRMSETTAPADAASKHVIERVAVQPIAIAYSSPAAAWVGDDDLLSHLWRTLRAPPLSCTVTFTPALSYTRASDRKRVAQTARTAILAALARQTAADEATEDMSRPAAAAAPLWQGANS